MKTFGILTSYLCALLAAHATVGASAASAAPLRGTVATVDNPISSDKTLIYGPFEAGFSAAQTAQFFGCTGDVTIAGGLDTLLAEEIVEYECDKTRQQVSVLDDCGGHARPYHYHEKMTCLYSDDGATGHSTRIGTALDGNGIYGKYVAANTLPTDLDACGGRTGVTPDSNGQEVYYYMVQDVAPFTVGCFGPVASVAECRALYSSCGDGDETTVTTRDGSRQYDPDCPCFDSNGSNVGASSGGGGGGGTTVANPTTGDGNSGNSGNSNGGGGSRGGGGGGSRGGQGQGGQQGGDGDDSTSLPVIVGVGAAVVLCAVLLVVVTCKPRSKAPKSAARAPVPVAPVAKMQQPAEDVVGTVV